MVHNVQFTVDSAASTLLVYLVLIIPLYVITTSDLMRTCRRNWRLGVVAYAGLQVFLILIFLLWTSTTGHLDVGLAYVSICNLQTSVYNYIRPNLNRCDHRHSLTILWSCWTEVASTMILLLSTTSSYATVTNITGVVRSSTSLALLIPTCTFLIVTRNTLRFVFASTGPTKWKRAIFYVTACFEVVLYYEFLTMNGALQSPSSGGMSTTDGFHAGYIYTLTSLPLVPPIIIYAILCIYNCHTTYEVLLA